MSNKTTNVFTRVDPDVKEQAEKVLGQLGLSMATAMEIYLRQIAFLKKIPFDLALPTQEKPISYEGMTKQEFNELMQIGFERYANGETMSLSELQNQLDKEIEL